MNSEIDNIRPSWLALLLVTAALGALGYFGISLARNSGQTAMIWYPNALLIALLLRSKFRNCLYYAYGAFVANVIAHLMVGDAVHLAVGLSLANLVEVAGAYIVLSRLNLARPAMDNLRELLIFAGVALFAAPNLSGLIAAATLSLSSPLPVFQLWRDWAITHAMSMLVLAPTAMVLADAWRSRKLISRSKFIEGFAIILTAGALTFGVFWQANSPILIFEALVVVFCALRLGTSGTAIATVGIAVIASVLTAKGLGPLNLVHNDLASRTFALQVFLASIFAIGLPVAALIAGKKRTEQELQESYETARKGREAFKALAELSPAGIFHMNANGLPTYFNAEWLEQTGLTKEKALKAGWFDALHEEDRERVKLAWSASQSEGSEFHCEFRFHRPDGTEIWVHSSASPLWDSDKVLTGYVGANIDITARKAKEMSLAASAEMDDLTGVRNRKGFMARLDEVYQCGTIHGKHLGMIDVDRFKLINDNAGHAAGDEVLKVLGSILAAEVRQDDVVARLGGDEFAILLMTRDNVRAEEICQRIVRAVGEREVTLASGQRLRIQISCGLAQYRAGETKEEWLHQADMALYEAKRGGRNQLVAA